MSLMSHVAEKLQQAIADMRAESAELRDTAEELDETEMDEEDW